MTRLVFKIRSESIYSSFKFPRKVRLQKDELLSSWLIRLSLLHRTMPMTFTNLYLPDTKNRFWVADIDLQADPVLLEALSKKSDLPVEMLRAMTLRSYEGYLFEEAHGNTGATPFINPLGLRGRRSSLPGLRYCPLCLREDEQPYFRKKWRLAFSVFCPQHHCYLMDRCPECGTPLTPYLSCKEGKIEACYKCGGSLLGGEVLPIHEDCEILKTVECLYSVLDDGYAMVGDTEVYSHLYFSVLHQILRLMMSKRYGPKLLKSVGMNALEVSGCKTFESMPIRDQARMLIKAVWLLNEWPQRFISICERNMLLSSALLKDLEQTPFWYWQIVVVRLYNPDKVVTANEIQEAAKFMEKRGMPISEASLSKMLGVTQVFRKRAMELGDLV